MTNNVTYHQQVGYCGKAQCRKCREGIGHGPYWYAYRTENGRTTRTYVGKNLPPELQTVQEPISKPSPLESDRVTLRIHVLGQFSLERKNGLHWQAVTDKAWQHQRVRVLLAYLLSSPGRKISREQIIDALWPDADPDKASSQLDRSVHTLRQILEPALSRPALSNVLRIERESLLLADQASVWVDADAFEQLLIQAQNTGDSHTREKLLAEAVALYGGDFLPEERLADWTTPRREALQRRWLGLLLDTADLHIERASFAHAVEPLDRLLASDSTNEAAVQRLILALARLDRRGEALRAYHHFTDALKRDYNAVPLTETRQLYEAVQHGNSHISLSLPIQNVQNQKATRTSESEAAPTSRQQYTVQIGRIHQSPLIGRNSELEIMQQILLTTEQEARSSVPGRKKISLIHQERRHHPQCIVLVGEAGIGKTRLAEELSHEAQKRGWAVAWSRVYAQESGVPYRQWTELLRHVIAPGNLQKQEIGKYPLIFQPLADLLPELHGLLPQIAFPVPLSPEQEQLRLWEATLAVLEMMSARAPLLLVLDDLHWADASSSALFAYLVRRLQRHPIVIIGTYRDNELPSTNPLRSLLIDLQREQAIAQIPIQPLTNEQISSLVSHLPHLPETVVQYIQIRAAGNPFFAEELARSLETETDQPTNLAEQTDSSYPLPDTIAAVLELRMGRLSSPCQKMLSNAAILGGSFTFQVMSQMETANVNEDILLDQIEEAIEAGTLTEEGTGTRITYHFWHPLLVSYLNEQLSAARRARLHRRAAEVLRLTYADHEAEKAATITNHLINGGGDPSQIIHYAELAADRAYTLSAYPEAERYYRIAVAQLDEHISSTSNKTQVAQEHLSYLLERFGECLRVQSNSEEGRRAFERILAMRQQLHAFASNTTNYKHEAQIDAVLWREISVTWYATGNTTMARQCCEQGEQALHKAEVEGGPAWAILRFEQSYIYWREGDYEAARRMALEAMQLFEEARQYQIHPLKADTHITVTKRVLLGDPVNLGHMYELLGIIANSVGQSTEAIVHLKSALTLFEQAELQREIANVCCNIGDVHLRKAEHELAQSFFRRSLHLTKRVGDISLMSIVFGNLGEVAARLGDLQQAEALFKSGLALAEKVNEPIYMNVLSVDLAIIAQDQDRLSEASTYILKALTIGRSIHNTPCICLALVVLGNLRVAQALKLHHMQKGVHKEKSADTLRDIPSKTPASYIRLLLRAKTTLNRVLAIEGLDAETRIKGQLAIAQVLMLLGELKKAQKHIDNTLEEAQQHELKWWHMCAQRVLGSILAERDQQELAKSQFEQAMRTFRESGTRLEYARTLQSYGTALLQGKRMRLSNSNNLGLQYLHEAQQIFSECHAALDLQIVEDVLTAYSSSY